MTSFFRLRPDATTYNYTDSHVGRGVDYDDNFAKLPMRALMWDLEQRALREWTLSVRGRSVLDLACGTGRITQVLARTLPDAKVVGVDVAESMLRVARHRVPDAEFVQGDVRGLHGLFPNSPFDLVTAFRFFPNAEAELCQRAASAIDTVLRPGGHVILNNHRNFWSPSYLARRARPGSAAPGALNSEVLETFTGARGYRVVARRSFGITLHDERRAYGLSNRRAERIEAFNERTLSTHHSLGTNTLWVLEKPGATAEPSR